MCKICVVIKNVMGYSILREIGFYNNLVLCKIEGLLIIKDIIFVGNWYFFRYWLKCWLIKVD